MSGQLSCSRIAVTNDSAGTKPPTVSSPSSPRGRPPYRTRTNETLAPERARSSIPSRSSTSANWTTRVDPPIPSPA